jgi:hypothetical protein
MDLIQINNKREVVASELTQYLVYIKNFKIKIINKIKYNKKIMEIKWTTMKVKRLVEVEVASVHFAVEENFCQWKANPHTA